MHLFINTLHGAVQPERRECDAPLSRLHRKFLLLPAEGKESTFLSISGRGGGNAQTIACFDRHAPQSLLASLGHFPDHGGDLLFVVSFYDAVLQLCTVLLH